MNEKHKKHIKRLEELLQNEKSLSKVADYFLSHLGEDRSFTQKGTLTEKHSTLETVVKQIVGKMFQKD